MKNLKYGNCRNFCRLISIPSNIAEGSGRKSNKDYAHFINLAYGSLVELVNQLIISFELKYIEENQYVDIRSRIEEIGNKLNSLRNSILLLPKSTDQQITESPCPTIQL